MNFLNVNFNGIKNHLVSVNIFNLNFNRNKITNQIEKGGESLINNEDYSYKEKAEDKIYKKYHSPYQLDKILDIQEDIEVYLFIELVPSTNWNLILPIIVNSRGQQILIFSSSGFSLQGNGGGLHNSTKLIRHFNLNYALGN